MENTATLTYTTEVKGFIYEDETYKLTGNKTTDSLGVFCSVDNGSIQKGGNYIGGYYARIENGKVRLSISDLDPEDYIAVYNLIHDLIEELGE